MQGLVLCVWSLFLLVVIVRSDHVSGSTSKGPVQPTATPKPPLMEDTSTCHVEGTSKVSFPPDLPKLDDQFEARVECKILQHNYTVDVIEYYDNINNLGAVYRLFQGKESSMIYNFDEMDLFLIEDGKCTSMQLDNKKFNFFNFTRKGSSGHIVGVNDLFNFGSKYNEVYMGEDEIRGIPVNHWASCITWDRYKTEFRLDYYFTKPDYMTALGMSKQIPVQLKLTGTSISEQGVEPINFDHIYDFVFYRPGPIRDERVFQVPKGVVCEHQNNSTKLKKKPTIGDHFSMEIEVVNTIDKTVSVMKQYYDYIHNLSRLDHKPEKTSSYRKYGNSLLHIIHDYTTGREYIINSELENCTVQPINMELIGRPPVDGNIDSNKHLYMKHGQEVYNLKESELKYQGVRTVRDVECEVWVYRKPTLHITVEAYFTQANWSPAGEMGEDPTQTPMGLLIQTTGNGSSTWYIQHWFNYIDVPPPTSTFDIRLCFDVIEEMKHFMVKVDGKYDDIVTGKKHHMEIAVRSAIAQAARILPIRVTYISFQESEKDTVDIWMTLLEKPNVKGSIPHVEVSMEEAYSNLEKVINTKDGMRFTVHYDGDEAHDLLMKAGSLKTDREMADPRVQPIVQQKSGHSNGSMAGLAIFMLVLGVLGGLGIGFYFWKRNRGFPYQVQN